MKSELSPAIIGHHRPKNMAWSVSDSTMQDTQDADACMVPEDWQYSPSNSLAPPPQYPVPPPKPSR